MKNGQNGQHDDPPQRSTTLPSTTSGWGNNRCVTPIKVRETADMLFIQTTLLGLDPASLVVRIQGAFFIVEGSILQSGGRGRYIRHVPELSHARDDFVDVTYDDSGQLIIRVLLKGSDGEVINP